MISEAHSLNSLHASASRRRMDQLVKLAAGSGALVSLLVSIAIVVSLSINGFRFIGGLVAPSETDIRQVNDAGSSINTIGLDRLWGDSWAPRFLSFDIKTLLVGTLEVTAIAMLVAVPLGLGVAIFISEYASRPVRKIAKPAVEVLAGMPSIVIAFFALSWISPNLVRSVFGGAASQQNYLAAGIGVGLLTVPLIASISEDALKSVPKGLREASVGLGATNKITTLSVIIPAAVSGIIASVIIGGSRAVGETMVVFLAAGGSGNQAAFNANPLSSGTTMTAAMASQVSGSDNVVSDLAFESLFFVGIFLFVITMGFNLLADRLVQRYRARY